MKAMTHGGHVESGTVWLQRIQIAVLQYVKLAELSVQPDHEVYRAVKLPATEFARLTNKTYPD